MYTLFMPPASCGKFHPTVLLKALGAFGLESLFRLTAKVPEGQRDWYVLMRLPSVHHLRPQRPQVPGVFDLLAPHREAIVTRAAGIVLDMGECFFSRDELFGDLHALLHEHGLAGCRIVIASGNRIAGARYREYCVRRGLPELVEFVATCGSAWSFAQSLPRRWPHRSCRCPARAGAASSASTAAHGRTATCSAC